MKYFIVTNTLIYDEIKNKYKKDKNIELINPELIFKKLKTNDVLRKNPTDEIVNFNIIRKISNSCKSKRIEKIFYFVDSIDETKINDIKKILNDFESEYVLVLNIKNLDKSYSKYFDYISND